MTTIEITSKQVSSFRTMTSKQVYEVLRDLYNKGQMVELANAAQQVIHENNSLVLRDLNYPTAFQYLGVAQYVLGDLPKATKTFETAVQANDDDVMSWIHLGNCYLYQMKLSQATTALEVAVLHKGATHEMHRLFKSRNWMADWQDRDEMLAQVEQKVINDARESKSNGINPLDFAELPSSMVIELSRQLHQVGSATYPTQDVSPEQWQLRTPELRLGFVSSDFGVHPVATLMRGMLSMLTSDKKQHKIIVYCFSLQTAGSWWKRNITRTVDYMVSLHGRNPSESAEIIRGHNIHILVDLNGHTLHSGLPIMSYRPAPVQISFLGYPMTTGSPAIDFFITDRISTPVESSRSFFTEKLLVLPTHYIVNDHMQLLGHTQEENRPSLPSVIQALIPDRNDAPVIDPYAFVFATFSNWQKMDPPIFASWMAILARIPNSVMWFLQYSGHADAKIHLQQEAMAHGIDGVKRLVFTPLSPWVNHTYYKRSADLVLDTSLKNGHTTMLDALYAGVPVLTLEGERMSNRAGSSALHSLDLQHILTVHSFKDYVEMAVLLATTSNGLLSRLRKSVEDRRRKYPLFDTQRYTSSFSSSIKSAWYITKSQRTMHMFSPTQIEEHEFPMQSALEDNHTEDEYEVRVQNAIDSQEPILLHIGGQQSRKGWWIIDVDDQRENVDFIMPMDNLFAFPDHSVTSIYASHVLEHVHYGVDREVHRTLREWYRVLRPDGVLFIAVPDLMVLSRLFIDPTLSPQDRFSVMRMMYGAQVDIYDVHKVGFDASFLGAFLADAGFCKMEPVASFGLFQDTSEAEFHTTRISLNVIARPCNESPKE